MVAFPATVAFPVGVALLAVVVATTLIVVVMVVTSSEQSDASAGLERSETTMASEDRSMVMMLAELGDNECQVPDGTVCYILLGGSIIDSGCQE